jgi:hypothetical protein
MNFLILIVVLLVLVPYCVPLAMPSWRWLGACVCAAVALAAFLWWCIQSNMAAHPNGDAPDLDFLVVTAVFGFVLIGAVTRAVTLWMRENKKPRGWRIAVSFATLPLVLGLWLVPSLWRSWNNRGPSEACAAVTSFKVDVAGGHFAIPSAELFNIYLGLSPAMEVYYLRHPSEVRRLCDRTYLGSKTIDAKSIWIKFSDMQRLKYQKSGLCTDTTPAWAGGLCASFAASERWDTPSSDWPVEGHVFALSEGKPPSGFGASTSSYDKAKTKPQTFKDNYDVIATSWTTPDGKPFAAQCYSSSNATEFCTTSFPWRDGMHLHFSFRAQRDSIEARGLSVFRNFESLLVGLMRPEAH